MEVKKLINEEVILTDINGMIRASTNPTRIGNFHEGAVLAIQEKKAIHMTDEKVKKLRGVKYGIVLPLFIHGQPFGVIGITGTPEVVEPYAHLLQKVTELFIQDFAYREEQERLARELELFAFDWLHSKRWDEELIERAAFFQIDIFSFRQVIVFKSSQDPFQLQYSDLQAVKQKWGICQDALFFRWGQEKLLLFIPNRTKSLKKHEVETLRNILLPYTNGDLIVGVGQHLSAKDIQTSYHQAERASVVAAKRKGIVFEADLQFDIIQYALPNEVKHEFIQRTIQPLENEQALMRTLQVWFEHNLSNKAAANALHIHINTLNYRLKNISELTSLDLKNTHHLVMLYIAFRFLSERTNNSKE